MRVTSRGWGIDIQGGIVLSSMLLYCLEEGLEITVPSTNEPWGVR